MHAEVQATFFILNAKTYADKNKKNNTFVPLLLCLHWHQHLPKSLQNGGNSGCMICLHVCRHMSCKACV